MTYRHKETGMVGVVAWQTEHEAAIDCPSQGLVWTGTVEAFWRLWEPLAE